MCFIAGFGTALHFFYFPRFKTTIDLFSADKKIATRIASTSLCSMFTKVNIPFVCVPCSPLHSFGIYLRKYFVRSLRNSPWIRNLYEISEKERMNSPWFIPQIVPKPAKVWKVLNQSLFLTHSRENRFPND